MLLPTPEGPESTIGRLSEGMGGVEAQLEVDILADEVAMRVLIVEVRARRVKGAMRFIDCHYSIGSTAAVV